MNDPAREQKAALRQRIKALRTQWQAEMAEWSAQIVRHLTAAPFWQAAQHVMGYWPLPGEIDIAAALLQAMAEGKTVYLPRVLAAPPLSQMEAARVEDWERLAPGRWGLREPPAAAPAAARLDLVIVPGLAFDRRGRRLGYGAGYYDRFLGQQQSRIGTTCGVALSALIDVGVPQEPHDRRVDWLVTQDGLLDCRSGEA